MSLDKRDAYKKSAEIRRGECDDELPDFEVINSWIQRCAVTWLGGLLTQVVHRCVTEPFFANDEALRKYINRVIDLANDPTSVLRTENRDQ